MPFPSSSNWHNSVKLCQRYTRQTSRCITVRGYTVRPLRSWSKQGLAPIGHPYLGFPSLVLPARYKRGASRGLPPKLSHTWPALLVSLSFGRNMQIMGDQQVEKQLLPMMSDDKKDADDRKTFGNASLKVNNFIFISCDLNPVKKTKIPNSGTTLICRPCWRRPCPCWPSATPSLSSSSAGLLSSPSIRLVSICRWVSCSSILYWK